MDNAPALAAAADSSDPSTGLRAVAALRRLLEQLEALQVDNAREHGKPGVGECHRVTLCLVQLHLFGVLLAKPSHRRRA